MNFTQRIFLLFCFVSGCCVSQCSAQVVRLQIGEDKGTAVCIGECENGSRLFVTAKHNFKDYNGEAHVRFRGGLYRVTEINSSDLDDVASFECIAPVAAMPIFAGDLPSGSEVKLVGYGPEYQGQLNGNAVRFGRLSDEETITQTSHQVVPGDSGGAVAYQYQTIGLISGFVTDCPSQTVFVSARKIHRCVSRIYTVRCPPGGCPIYLRPSVRQPILGIGIPIGPPQLVTEAVPVPRPPQIYDPRPTPDPEFSPGPRGPAGPQGPPGRDGESVSREHVEAVVNAWLSANAEQLRPDLSAIEKRLTAVEQRPFRIILSSDGKIVDDETYPAGDPVVLDLQRLRGK